MIFLLLPPPKNHYFFTKLGQNMHFIGRYMVLLPFLFFLKISKFFQISHFYPKNGIFGSTVTQITQSGHLINNSKGTNIKATTLYIYHLVKESSLYQLLLLTYQRFNCTSLLAWFGLKFGNICIWHYNCIIETFNQVYFCFFKITYKCMLSCQISGLYHQKFKS